MSNARAFVHQRSMLPRGLPVPDRKPQGPTVSRHALPQTALVLQVLLVPRLLVLDLCVVACHPRPRLTTSHRALTMLLLLNLLLNPFKRSHLLHITSSQHSLIASQIPTMDLMLAASLHLHHRLLPLA